MRNNTLTLAPGDPGSEDIPAGTDTAGTLAEDPGSTDLPVVTDPAVTPTETPVSVNFPVVTGMPVTTADGSETGLMQEGTEEPGSWTELGWARTVLGEDPVHGLWLAAAGIAPWVPCWRSSPAPSSGVCIGRNMLSTLL